MKLRWIVLIVAALLASGLGVAYAAKAPNGPYRDTCTAASVSRDVLKARCEKARHRRVWARLERVSTCVGEVSNHQGQLICLRKRDVPAGDWSDSCINPHLASPGVFAAICKSLRGGWIASTIALNKCGGGITNSRGHLGCKKPRVADLPPAASPRSTLPPAPAPTDDEPNEEPVAASVPPPAGPYQDTCRAVAFDGRYLSGECKSDRGRWQDTSLDTKSCSRDQVIGNDDGDLVCTRRPGREPPAGLYTQTCKDVTFDGRFVRADCKDAKGTWMRALLDMRVCQDSDEIVNVDAELICRAPAPPLPPPAPTPPAAATAEPLPVPVPPPAAEPLPPPQPAASITLYDGASFEGASKTLSGDAPDLAPLGWTDLASSLQVRGGVWLVCDQVNYGGHCERILEDEPNLGDLDLSDRIKSLRQLNEPSAPATP